MAKYVYLLHQKIEYPDLYYTTHVVINAYTTMWNALFGLNKWKDNILSIVHSKISNSQSGLHYQYKLYLTQFGATYHIVYPNGDIIESIYFWIEPVVLKE